MCFSFFTPFFFSLNSKTNEIQNVTEKISFTGTYPWIETIINSHIVVQSGISIEVGNFDFDNVNITGTTYSRVSITGVKITRTNDHRAMYMGTVMAGNHLGGSFLVYNGWVNAFKKL